MYQLFSMLYQVLLLEYIWINLIFREVDGSEKRDRKTECSNYEYRCSLDGSCIDRALVCDGLKDCPDGSDETAKMCGHKSWCKEEEFRCAYGACIQLSAKCDGRIDCADNSDETNADCPPIANIVTLTVHCNPNLFQCVSSGKCIDPGLLCDGKGDCDDNSDETLEQCENSICSRSQFRCNYGACIDSSNACDGKKDCFDGSDEYEKTCFKDASAPHISPFPPDVCFLPSDADIKNMQMSFDCRRGKGTCADRKGANVSIETIVRYSCKNGLGLPDGQNSYIAQCKQGWWDPYFDTCERPCKVLKPENVDLTCFYKGRIVDCIKAVVGSTSVRPRCKADYHPTQPIHYRQIHCLSSGKWTNELFKCVKDCGKPVTIKHVKPLIANASVEKFGEAPWHVAIYNTYMTDSTDPQLICGGTIISPYLVVSAAHCFFEPSLQKLNYASDFEIVVSKYSRPYSKKDNRYTKTYQIREIILPKNISTEHATRYASDIVILWLREEISFNQAVMPACVPWSKDTQLNAEEGSLLLASGFGQTGNGTKGKRRIVKLPFIGRNKCIKPLYGDFKDIMALNQFCTGSETGFGVGESDSGGGLLFRNPDLGVYYLQGIVSVKDNSSAAVFTSINSYLDWMEEVRIRVQTSLDYIGSHGEVEPYRYVERGKKPIRTGHKFECKTDESYIDYAFICDGLKDCSDSSDESLKLCKYKYESCNKDQFKCTYGACVQLSAKCDGRTDCVDNSDETNADCPPIANDVTSTVLCNPSQFQCAFSGKCIDRGLLCDGKGDCDDKSDETLEQCENTICSRSQFRCDYGACINGSSACDEKKDCLDGSDEYDKTCLQDTFAYHTQRPPNVCFFPSNADMKNLQMKINCPKGKPTCTNLQQRNVSRNTVVQYHCKNGYGLPSGRKQIRLVCDESWWNPDFEFCKKACKVLQPENVDLTCSYDNKRIDCVKTKVDGTSVRPRCKAHYHATQPIHYRQIHCQSNGKWTNELFKCVPDCGKSVTIKHVKPLIANASVEEFGEAPWHVAIYNVKDSKNRQLICGGTLISPHLVISAAHCFFQPSLQKLNNVSDYEIVVSKYSRLYSKQDNRYTKKYKVREIILPKNISTGHSTRYASDIVILWVKEKISLNQAVMPACIPRSKDIQFNPGANLGLASGFGKTGNGTRSKSSRIVQLPFIGRNKCIKPLDDDFKDIVTLDKFCTGSEKGSGVREGDSGGGLLFRNPLGIYYLQGIFSVKDNSSSVVVFTSINSYLDWMEEVRIRVQKSIQAWNQKPISKKAKPKSGGAKHVP